MEGVWLFLNTTRWEFERASRSFVLREIIVRWERVQRESAAGAYAPDAYLVHSTHSGRPRKRSISAVYFALDSPDLSLLPTGCLPARSPVCFPCSEIVLLDFHRFPGLGHGPPHEKAAEVVLETLDGVMIHPKHRKLDFGKLLNQQPGRVAVLWNAVEVRSMCLLNLSVIFVQLTCTLYSSMHYIGF